MIDYIPRIRGNTRIVDVRSTWGDIPGILVDIIDRFRIGKGIALEFGVERGYSISALANYFKRVIGVDTFRYNISDLSREKPSEFYDVLKLLKDYPNIQLIESLFEDFIQHDIYDKYDLIHVDIIHKYEPTYICGEWSLKHSDCVLFHDTVSRPEVMRAVFELSNLYNFEFYNYQKSNGLGILIKK
jgi:predicted O-methyltransferase YrrM